MTMQNLIMAYLGDAVYELYVREYLINKGISNVNDLQKESLKYVSATSQKNILEELINNNILTGEEQEIVRKGRNAPSHKSKSTDIVTYHKATGFECLIGYLYQNNKDNQHRSKSSYSACICIYTDISGFHKASWCRA